jgi:hypothetical protein
MKIRLIFASLITAATLAACSSAPKIATEDDGIQPTLEELNADNDSSLELAGSTGGLGNLLVRKIYDKNQNGKYDEEEPGIPDWGVRIVSVDDNGNPDDAADLQVTPQGSQRWRGVSLKVPFGRYKIEELEPTTTKQAGVNWKVTGQASRIVNVSRSKPIRAIEFAGVCLENGAVVKFPKLENFYDWKCHATFNLLPRISSFTATPDQIQSGGSSTLAWNVLDYSKLEITPTVGVVTGFTGSKSVTPSSTTAYTLKATNGFGSRTVNVTVHVGSSASGKWSVIGNLKYATGPNFRTIPLGADQFIIVNGLSIAELYDFKTGLSKQLNQFIAFLGSARSLQATSNQKLLAIPFPGETTMRIYDPSTDTSSTVNIAAAANAFPLVRWQGDVFLAAFIPNPTEFGAYARIALGFLDLSTYTFTKTADPPVTVDPPGTHILTVIAGLTKEKNVLFTTAQIPANGSQVVMESRAIIVNPLSGAVLSNKMISDPNCFYISPSSFVQSGPSVLLNNGNFLRVGGTRYQEIARIPTDHFCEYDPASNTIVQQGTANQTSQGTPFLLSNGQVLVLNNSTTFAEQRADLYDSISKTFTLTSPFQQSRGAPLDSAVGQLADGRVVVFAGAKPIKGEPLSSIEVYTP